MTTDSGALHEPDAEATRRALDWLRTRLDDGPELGRSATQRELSASLGSPSITAAGLGVAEAWRRFAEVLAPATIGLDHPRFLAFIPAAPSPSAQLMDAVVSVATFSGESWLEAAGAVYAENEVLAFLAELAGLPAGASGCFVSGGSAGNLSALAVARDARPDRPGLLVADTAHASLANAAHLLGMPLAVVATDRRGRMDADAAERELARPGSRIGTVVASAGSTNAGSIDPLQSLAAACAAHDTWLHVDAAYGGAALLVERMRPAFVGVEHADSFIVDPHKWLFGPLGSCALLYRDPAAARGVHTQHAAYLDALHDDGGWNPADHAFQLTRRAGGLAPWFALAAHGTRAHADAVERGIELAWLAARRIEAVGPPLELVLEPELSVVLFRRHGWDDDQWRQWSRRLLDDGVAFVTPTRWKGETVGRLVFLHPRTPEAVIDEILASTLALERGAHPGAV